MKKLISVIAILGIILLGGFYFLLSQTSPDKAPKGEIIIDVTPKSDT